MCDVFYLYKATLKLYLIKFTLLLPITDHKYIVKYNAVNVCLWFQLDSPVMARGPVELWLGELQLKQQASLHSIIKASDLEINDEDFDPLSFLDKFQAQVSRQ